MAFHVCHRHTNLTDHKSVFNTNPTNQTNLFQRNFLFQLSCLQRCIFRGKTECLFMGRHVHTYTSRGPINSFLFDIRKANSSKRLQG